MGANNFRDRYRERPAGARCGHCHESPARDYVNQYGAVTTLCASCVDEFRRQDADDGKPFTLKLKQRDWY